MTKIDPRLEEELAKLREQVQEMQRKLDYLEKNNWVKTYPPVSTKFGCPECGMGADGKPTGYVCYNPKCPTRITF